MKFYAGIGSRETPADVQETMRNLASALGFLGYTLRSGAAMGADSAFEQGADRNGYPAHIYLPWEGFARRRSGTSGTAHYILPGDQRSFGEKCAREAHPAWQRLNSAAQALMIRNTFQVLGFEGDTPSSFVVCWTKDGAEERTSIQTGGTGQAIRLARMHDIPVFNLHHNDALPRLSALVRGK